MRKVIPINTGVSQRLRDIEELARDCAADCNEQADEINAYLDTYIDTFPSDVEPTVVEFPRDKVDRAIDRLNETPNVVYLNAPKPEKL